MIKYILKFTGHKHIAFTAIVLMIVGLQMPDSPVPLSTGMIMLVANSLFNLDIKKNFKAFIADKALVALTLIFFIFLFSAINSTNMNYLGERLRIKLPFLAMPFAFVVFKDKPKMWFHLMLYLFFITIVALCGYEFIQYMSDFRNIDKLYETSYVIDTPGSHVRFSLMIAFSIFTGIYLIQQQFLKAYRLIYISTIIFTLFLIVYIHILAVRSGIVAFYLSIGYIVLYSIFNTKNYKVGFVLLALLIAAPFTVLKLFPTLQNKYNYTQYSLYKYSHEHQVNHFSDGARIQSVIIGYKLFHEHWLTGVGIGNLQDDMYKVYAKDYPEVEQQYWFIPHNEFLVFAAGCGIFGFLAFTIIIFFVVFYKKSWLHWLFAVFNIIIISSFFTEPTIEEQVGTAFYVIFFLVLYFIIHYSNDKPVGSNNNV